MNPNSAVGQKLTYYNWAEYASFLSYRRIQYADATTKSSSPFDFAFIPGALLHSSSSVRVPMHISLSIKFTTYATPKDADASTSKAVVVNEQEKKLFYIISVSRATSAAMRFDSDSYEPKIVTVKVPGLGRKSATALLIILLIAVAVVLAGSIYVEITYKRIIHNAKYHPKRPDSAVGVRYGRDGQPIGGGPAESVASSPQPGSAHSPISGISSPSSGVKKSPASNSIKTKFGNVGVEPARVPDFGDDTTNADTKKVDVADGGNKKASDDGAAASRPPIGEEQERVSDSEVASRM